MPTDGMGDSHTHLGPVTALLSSIKTLAKTSIDSDRIYDVAPDISDLMFYS